MYLSSGTLPCVDFLDVSYHGRYTNSLCVYYACQRSGSPPTVWGAKTRSVDPQSGVHRLMAGGTGPTPPPPPPPDHTT